MNTRRIIATLLGFVGIIFVFVWILSYLEITDIDINSFGLLGVATGVFALIPLVLQSKKDNSSTKEPTLRETLIDVVENNWIKGVLDDALRDTDFEIVLKESPERLGDETPFKDYRLPFHLVESDATTPDNRTKTGDVLLKAFDHTGRKLLILGAPGSGKTVLLLQLAKKLLDEAHKDEKQRIPVVFNLSSWAEKRENLADWLAGQLKQNYGVSDKLAQEWIAGDKLIYLLDGFDEVAENYREDCLTEINNFKTLTRQLVICSRIKEFEALSQPMSTKFAVELLPMPDEQFTDLLYTHLPERATVDTMIRTLKADDEVWEEVKKPLFINILLNTYADGRTFPEQNIQGTTRDKLEQLVLEPYVTRQLENNPDPRFDNADSLRWLSWIGHNLVEREQTVFYVEMLQVDWLYKMSTQRNLKVLFVLIFGLIIGLISGLSFGLIYGLHNGLIFGLIVGLIGVMHIVMIFGLSDIKIERFFKLVLRLFLQVIWENKFTILIVGLMYGLIIGLIDGLSVGLIYRLVIGLVIGLVNVVFGGLIFGVNNGLNAQQDISSRNNINQGLQETAIAGLLVGPLVGLIYGLAIGLISWLAIGLIIGLIYGLFGGLIVGLISGLADVIKHLILRWVLIHQNLAPHRYDHFLLAMVERRLMRRVGGSVIFIHRYLLEYFANEWERTYAKQYQ